MVYARDEAGKKCWLRIPDRIGKDLNIGDTIEYEI